MCVVVVTRVQVLPWYPVDKDCSSFGLQNCECCAFNDRGEVVGQLEHAALAAIRGARRVNVLGLLSQWTRGGIHIQGVLLHPQGTWYGEALNELRRRNQNQAPEQVMGVSTLMYTRDGSEDSLGYWLGQAVTALAASCRGRSPDRFRGVLEAVQDVFRKHSGALGDPDKVVKATREADTYVQSAYSSEFSRREPRNPAAEALHQIHNLIGPLLLDLESFEDGRIDKEYIQRAWGGKAKERWDEAAKLAKRILGEEAFQALIGSREGQAFLSLINCLNSGQAPRDFSATDLRANLCRRLEEMLRERQSRE